MGARTWNLENFYFLIEIHLKSMYIGLLSQNKLLCQQVAITIMQLDHITMHIPSLIRIEKDLGLETGPRTSKIATFLQKLCKSMYICHVPQNQQLCKLVAIITMHIAYSNTHSKFD